MSVSPTNGIDQGGNWTNLIIKYAYTVLLHSYSGGESENRAPVIKQLRGGSFSFVRCSAMNQSQFLAITCNSLEAREKSRVHGAIGFDSDWLKNWRESFKPINKRSYRNHVISFDIHLKTALTRLRLFRLVIGWKFSRQFLNQWEAKPKPRPKPIASCTRDFSLALS